MDITLENIATVEIPADLQTALLGKLEPQVSPYLTQKGFVVKPKAEYDTEFNTEVAKREKAFADSEAPKFYGAMDKMLAAVGLKKPDGVSTAAYVKQLSDEHKLPFTAEQLAKVEAILKGEGGGSSADKALADQLRKEFDDYKKAQDAEKKQGFEKYVKRVVDSALKAAPVLIDPALKDEAAKQAAKTATINDLSALFNTLYEGAEDEAGVFGFRKRGTTEFLMNTATGEPMTALEIVRKNHSLFLVPAGHQQAGTGTGSPGTNQQQPTNTINDIHKRAADLGLRLYSDAWHKFVNEEKAKLK